MRVIRKNLKVGHAKNYTQETVHLGPDRAETSKKMWDIILNRAKRTQLLIVQKLSDQVTVDGRTECPTVNSPGSGTRLLTKMSSSLSPNVTKISMTGMVPLSPLWQ